MLLRSKREIDNLGKWREKNWVTFVSVNGTNERSNDFSLPSEIDFKDRLATTCDHFYLTDTKRPYKFYSMRDVRFHSNVSILEFSLMTYISRHIAFDEIYRDFVPINVSFWFISISLSLFLSLRLDFPSHTSDRSIARNAENTTCLLSRQTRSISRIEEKACVLSNRRGKKGRKEINDRGGQKKRYIMNELNTLAWLISLTSESITPPFVWEPWKILDNNIRN